MILRDYLRMQGVDTGGPDFTVGEQELVVDPVLRAIVPGYTGVDIKSAEAYQVYRSHEGREVPASFDQSSDVYTDKQIVAAGDLWGGTGPSRTVGVDDYGADGQLGTGGDVFDTDEDLALFSTYQGRGAYTPGAGGRFLSSPVVSPGLSEATSYALATTYNMPNDRPSLTGATGGLQPGAPRPALGGLALLALAAYFLLD